MGAYLELLGDLRLGSRALLWFGRVEGARARWQARGGGTQAAAQRVRSEDPPLPAPDAGALVALQFLHAHYASFTPDPERLLGLWRAVVPEEVPRPTGEPLARFQEVADWAAWELEYARHPALLVMACALAELLVASPFEQGNSRLAKLWATLMLLRAGYGYASLVPLEEVLRTRTGPLRALRERLGRRVELASLELWTETLLELLAEHADLALDRFHETRARAPLPRLQEQLLQIARSEGRLTSRRAQQVTEVSRNTLKDNFKRLVELGLLERHGRKRGIFYTLARGGEPGDGEA